MSRVKINQASSPIVSVSATCASGDGTVLTVSPYVLSGDEGGLILTTTYGTRDARIRVTLSDAKELVQAINALITQEEGA